MKNFRICYNVPLIVLFIFLVALNSVSCWKLVGSLHQQEERERADEQLSSPKNKKLWRNFYKETCLIEKSLKGQIIKTNVSLEAGARFIESLQFQTAAECQEKCCEHAEPCNTAVIRVKNYKPGVSCYLFDCKSPSVCSFDTHSDFKVIQLSSSSSSVQEHQLDELASTSQQDNRHSHASTSPTSPTNVQCSPGFHPVAGSCRKDCQKLSFECLNVDQPSLSQCIALYDKCDTFNQCDDGSDEVACSYDQQQDRRNDAAAVAAAAAAAGGGAGEKDDNGSHHTADPSTEMLERTDHSKSTPRFSTGSPTELLPATTAPAPLATTAASKSADRKNKSSVVANVGHREVNTGSASPPQMILELVNTHHRARGTDNESYDNLKGGAIVALSLGIALTLLSLILLFCRLQSCKRLSRKNKAKNMSGDSDYLINGLYL